MITINPNFSYFLCQPHRSLINKSPPQHDTHRTRTTSSRSPPGPVNPTARDAPATCQSTGAPRSQPPTAAKISLMITRHAHHASSGQFHAHSLTRGGQWNAGQMGRNNKRWCPDTRMPGYEDAIIDHYPFRLHHLLTNPTSWTIILNIGI